MEDTLVREPADLDKYVSNMHGSMEDKLFFAHRIPRDVSVFADFGCADGALLRELYWKRVDGREGSETYIGFDHSISMIDRAKHTRAAGHYEWTNGYEFFAARIERHRKAGEKVCLVLSSVVHEVLSQRPGEFIPFWDRLTKLGCEYIAVRDMAVAQWTHTALPDPTGTDEMFRTSEGWRRCWEAAPNRMRQSHFLEALIKHRYEDNLEAELQESYFPLTAEEWLSKPWGYRPIFYEHTPLPFLQNWWQERYGIWVPDPTHIKLIFQREA